jgi:hydrocephalus-inducing protein
VSILGTLTLGYHEEAFDFSLVSQTLEPNKQAELVIWAYPKVPQDFDDALVCCVKENPEPIIFKLKCKGVRPELELEKKILQFERMLLHR